MCPFFAILKSFLESVMIRMTEDIKKENISSRHPKYLRPVFNKRVSACYEWMEALITELVLVTLLFTFLFRCITVDGTSMLPNLQSEDRVIVSNFFYQPKPGDVVVLKRTTGLSKPIIKRVIATEGQKIDIDYNTGTVYVDDIPLDESSYIENGITFRPSTSEALLEFPQVVPEGYIFVLGDNRAVSEDSRFEAVGMVDERYILGKAEWIILPFERFGGIT